MGCCNAKAEQSSRNANPAKSNNSNNNTEEAHNHTKSLSNFNKTKGGSMLLNAAEKNMIGDDQTALSLDFNDTQKICSPSTIDWKVSKTVRKIPEMTQSQTIPIQIPESQGGGVIQAIVGYRSLQGKNPKPPHKPNQDCISIFPVEGHPNLVVFSCFDGHGPFGEHASHFCRSRLHPAMIAQGDELLRTNPKLAFTNAIAQVHASFCSEETLQNGVDPVVSGTTCVAILFDGKQIHIANVGDSRAIVGKLKEHELHAEPLTDDHKPQRPDERARLEKSEALLLTEREVRGFGDDSKIYICRERGGDIVYGVLFTRSLGDADAHSHLGVSALPEMGMMTLTDKDRYFILASDGVWDYMTNEEVMQFAQDFNDPLKVCDAITKEASERWETRDADHRRDDISVIVVKTEINEPNKAASAAAAATTSSD